MKRILFYYENSRDYRSECYIDWAGDAFRRPNYNQMCTYLGNALHLRQDKFADGEIGKMFSQGASHFNPLSWTKEKDPDNIASKWKDSSKGTYVGKASIASGVSPVVAGNYERYNEALEETKMMCGMFFALIKPSLK